MNTILGINVLVVPDQARYQLPAEVIPGVPWPPGFREEINAWAWGFFQPVNLLRDGEVISSPINNTMHVNPRTHAHICALWKDVK